MELFRELFHDIMEFNDYVNMRLINDHVRIVPITVIPHKGESLIIFYTKEEIEL